MKGLNKEKLKNDLLEDGIINAANINDDLEDEYWENEDAEGEDLGEITLSDRCKKRMNRIFREIAGINRIPYPEVDNVYERVRSFIVRVIYVIANKIRKSE